MTYPVRMCRMRRSESSHARVFVTYELDSAARFVDSLYAFARSRESHNFERIAALAETDVLMGRGLTDQAETLFRQIDTAGMTTLEYRNWYESTAVFQGASAATAINRAVVNDLTVRNRLRLWTTAVTSLLLVTFAGVFSSVTPSNRTSGCRSNGSSAGSG